MCVCLCYDRTTLLLYTSVCVCVMTGLLYCYIPVIYCYIYLIFCQDAPLWMTDPLTCCTAVFILIFVFSTTPRWTGLTCRWFCNCGEVVVEAAVRSRVRPVISLQRVGSGVVPNKRAKPLLDMMWLFYYSKIFINWNCFCLSSIFGPNLETC